MLVYTQPKIVHVIVESGNGHVTKLLDFCKSTNMYIVNSLVVDKFIGNVIFSNVSSEDYCIVTRNSFAHISNFEVPRSIHDHSVQF